MDMDWLIIYKAARLPLLFVAMIVITVYVYGRSKESIERPKYRMMEED